MARAVWSGSISFGLVNVPVKAFTAVRDQKVHFNQLEKGTGSRIKHQNVSANTGDPVERDDIELGYEVSDGRYVTFSREEVDALKPSSSKLIEVSDFVALSDVDPIYYERTYWLAPDGEAATKAYQLLLAAMEDRERVAIGCVVMRTKQYLAAIRPLDGALALSTMRFAAEVVDRSAVEDIPDEIEKPDEKTLDLALQIVDALESDWDPEQYKDTYNDELRELIERKASDETVVVSEGAEPSAKVLDLMAALEATVDAAKAARKREDVSEAIAEAGRELTEGEPTEEETG